METIVNARCESGLVCVEYDGTVVMLSGEISTAETRSGKRALGGFVAVDFNDRRVPFDKSVSISIRDLKIPDVRFDSVVEHDGKWLFSFETGDQLAGFL